MPFDSRLGVRPRVCLVTDSVEPSGVGEHMLALAGALRGAFDMVMACPASPGGSVLLDRAGRCGIAVKQLDDGDEQVVRWLRQGRFDLLHIHAGIGWEGHDLARMGRAADIARIVRTEHLPDVITDLEQRRAYLDGLGHVDKVVCVSAASGSSFLAAGLPASQLAVIRNGIAVRDPASPRAAVRGELGLSDRHCLILTVARFTPQKGHATLVDALPALLLREPNACLCLAGSGPLEEALRSRAEALGVSHAVRFLGFRDDVPDLLAAVDLFVLPSWFEGLPLALLEAMSAGRPVVATRVGGTDEVVEDGVTGLLVEPGDPAALAEAILTLIADRDVAHRFGIAGRARFADHFTAQRMADETARLYQGLAASSTAEKDIGMTSARHAPTRIGFIGAGGIAHRHLGILQHFDDVGIMAFADPADGRAQDAAERFGARAYRDYEVMLAEEELDAIYICVPPAVHGAPERAIIARGLPFFVEKPVAIELAVAEVIADAVAGAGLMTAVGYHWRYLDTVDEAKRLLADNPAQLLSGYWLDATPPPRWWWTQDQSGGQMNEQTTHIIDLARYLVGDVTQVFGLAGHRAREDFPDLDVATAATASLRFASGAIGNIGSTCLLRWNHRVGLHVFGDGLAMELTDHDIMVDVGRGRPVRHAEGDPVWQQDRDFIDAVRGGENRIRCPYAEALHTLRVTAAIQRSVATGRPVDLAAQPAEPAYV